MRYPAPVSLIIISMFLLSCLADDTDKSSQAIGDVKLYTFSSDDQYFLSNAQPFILSPETSLRDALDGLGRHLSDTYFSQTYTNDPTDIHFEVIRIDRISTPTRSILTGIINMIDENNDALGCFFQGSKGGQTTFCMLAATFMQPHLAQPLLDGLIILYNGKLLAQLDHINLSGLLIPRLVESVAKRAIHSVERKIVDSNHGTERLPEFKS